MHCVEDASLVVTLLDCLILCVCQCSLYRLSNWNSSSQAMTNMMAPVRLGLNLLLPSPFPPLLPFIPSNCYFLLARPVERGKVIHKLARFFAHNIPCRHCKMLYFCLLSHVGLSVSVIYFSIILFHSNKFVLILQTEHVLPMSVMGVFNSSLSTIAGLTRKNYVLSNDFKMPFPHYISVLGTVLLNALKSCH